MLADLIFFAIAHQFVSGFLLGTCAIGAPLVVLAWFDGYETCVRNVWRQIETEDHVSGDVPNLPHRDHGRAA